MRVLMLLNSLAYRGGAERFAVALSCQLAKQGIAVEMCATRDAPAAVQEQLAAAGVPLTVLGRRGTLDILPLRNLIRLVWRRDFQVLHAHLFGSSVWGVLTGKLAKVPVVLAHEHGTLPATSLHQFLYGRLVGRLATRYVVVSTSARAAMVERHAVPLEKTELVPAAYSPREDRGDADLRTELGIPADARVIGTIATFRPVKGLDVLIAAHARLLDTHPETHLVICGDGLIREDLERMTQRLGTGGRVHFLGEREEVGSVLRTLEVGVLSSHSEGTPIFVMECMAYRVPVVSTDVGGLRDVVEPDFSALLVPPRAPEALACAVARLLDHPEERERLTAAGAKRLSDFKLESIANRFVALYRRLLAESQGSVQLGIGRRERELDRDDAAEDRPGVGYGL